MELFNMVAEQSVSLFDDNLGSAFNSPRNCVDDRRCPLTVLQPINHCTSEISDGMKSTINRFISVICTIAIAFFLGEIASICPTAGGMQ